MGASPNKLWNHNTEKMAMTPLMTADKRTLQKAGDAARIGRRSRAWSNLIGLDINLSNQILLDFKSSNLIG